MRQDDGRVGLAADMESFLQRLHNVIAFVPQVRCVERAGRTEQLSKL